MEVIVGLILSAMAVLIASYIVPGVSVNSFVDALITAVVLGVVNALLRPLLLLLTLPINILTLGLFTFVVNALLVLLVARIVPGFRVNGLVAALLFSIVVSVISTLFSGVNL